MYIKHYLELYQQTLPDPKQVFKEDLHFSFVEYSGSNITHWFDLTDIKEIDIKRLCGQAFLISDLDQETKKERHKNLQEILGDRFCPLPCTEIENLIGPEVLLKVVADYEGIDYGKIKGELNQADYKHVRLGEFIETNILKKKKQRTGSYKTESGTIADKVSFCNKAIKFTRTWQDMSVDAQNLAERVYKFIQGHNN